jgi:uncharacterized membrane protein
MIEEGGMIELLVLTFNHEHRADTVLSVFSKLRKPEILDPQDSVVVLKDQKGQLHLKQQNEPLPLGSRKGNFWELLVGSLLFHPLSGGQTSGNRGRNTGAGEPELKKLGIKLIELDIRDAFVRELTQAMKPGTASVFLLTQKIDARKLQEIPDLRDAKILHAPLPKHELQRLRTLSEQALSGSTR